MILDKIKICKVIISIIISFSPLIAYEFSNYILNIKSKNDKNNINKNK